MCGAYYMDEDTLEELYDTIHEVDRKVREEKNTGIIQPMDNAPVLSNQEGRIQLSQKRFGYVGYGGKGAIFNARSETVLQKPMFQRGISSNRVVIPATSFFEWNAGKEKFTFQRLGGKILYFAGFHDLSANTDSFVILTTAANESMKPVHDRMPLILTEEQIYDWIYEEGATKKILRQVPMNLQRSCEYEQQTLKFREEETLNNQNYCQ